MQEYYWLTELVPVIFFIFIYRNKTSVNNTVSQFVLHFILRERFDVLPIWHVHNLILFLYELRFLSCVILDYEKTFFRVIYDKGSENSFFCDIRGIFAREVSATFTI